MLNSSNAVESSDKYIHTAKLRKETLTTFGIAF